MNLIWFVLQIFLFNLLTFGNGPAMVPMLQKELVDRQGVLTIEQLLYAFAIARVTPGQANVYVASIGFFLYGIAGAVLATLAIQLPGYMMLPFIQFYERARAATWIRNFTRGLTVASVGLIFAATLSIGASTLTSLVAWIVFAVALLLVALLRWNQILVIFLSALLGILLKVVLP